MFSFLDGVIAETRLYLILVLKWTEEVVVPRASEKYCSCTDKAYLFQMACPMVGGARVRSVFTFPRRSVYRESSSCLSEREESHEKIMDMRFGCKDISFKMCSILEGTLT